MKILLSGEFSDAMKKQPAKVIAEFIKAVDKLQDMAKPQILLLDTVIELSSSDVKDKVYAYHISENCYTIFTFNPNNELLLIDYVQVHNNSITALVYPSITF